MVRNRQEMQAAQDGTATLARPHSGHSTICGAPLRYRAELPRRGRNRPEDGPPLRPGPLGRDWI